MSSPSDHVEGKMHNLVVCGAVDAQSPADAALFADFMGISMTLRHAAPGAEGTALSCFPLDEHWDVLETRTPPITTIKWGKFWPNQTPLFTYSKAQSRTRNNKWFEYVCPEDILERVTTWIQDKAHSVAENDVVNIFLEAHGVMNGKINLGPKHLEISTVTNLHSQFPTNCQVNVVGSHSCSGSLFREIRASGQIARPVVADCGPEEFIHFTAIRSVGNRIRNFRSSMPFVQSLARVNFPWLPRQATPPIFIAEHEAFMREAMRRIIPTLSRPCQADTYTSHLSPKAQASVTLLEALILRDHVDVVFFKETVHRRRRPEWPTLDLQLMEQMQRTAAECDFDNAFRDDGPIMGRLEYLKTNMLAYYEFFTLELAGMISQGCAEPEQLIETIRYTEMLGSLLEGELQRLLRENNGAISFEYDPQDGGWILAATGWFLASLWGWQRSLTDF
ncbi:hypothetical protein MGYG_06673 [Nannizzia gypsea CBS 118893]|uniref:Uncharacterized protein n=1 Tax=Arthroderma gypseum (strain ATCC MYA-4604 / CBS 118893) TaxID=535722 RepID=E4V0W2_ARTGP|nr:hypothetical protein MGYG_06673 [Nannizzia gypsea CBS 118893]EFR03677.1 hypothetical protein MGYG_06673 [Nannizzia gypsea CBS 118893]